MAKRLKTYRLEPADCANFAAAVAITGETESDVIRGGIQAYIQRVLGGQIPSTAPVEASPVYTDREWPESYDEPPEEPAANPCKHPAEAVEAGECGICHADVW